MVEFTTTGGSVFVYPEPLDADFGIPALNGNLNPQFPLRFQLCKDGGIVCAAWSAQQAGTGDIYVMECLWQENTAIPVPSE